MLKCESCQQMFTPQPEDQKRIDEATINGIKFLVLKCTECYKHTSWKDEVLTSTSKETDDSENTTIQKDLMRLLPLNYDKYVSKFNGLDEFQIFENEDNFNIHSKLKLHEKINIDGSTYIRINQIEGYLKTIKELDLIKSKKDIELLENAISIGNENTRILFFDARKENSELYIFYPDNGDIDKTAFKLNDIINRRKV